MTTSPLAAPEGTGQDHPTDAGMTTAEYAIGTIAACSFAGVLLEVVRSPAVARFILQALQHAMTTLGW